MIDPQALCLFIPPGLSRFKVVLFDRLARRMGRAARSIPDLEQAAAAGFVPVVGCTPALRPHIVAWATAGRPWVYWDRGYLGRFYGTALAPGCGQAHYRWHRGGFQMQRVRDVPPNRFAQLGMIKSEPWKRGGRHIVVAAPSPSYAALHGIDGWVERTVAALRRHTDRDIRVREKTDSIPLTHALRDAHALVTHGSVAAVEAVVLGVPVFVDPVSAARHVGLTDLSQIESPIFPDRDPWLASLAYCQFDEREMVDGTMWRLLD